MCVLEVWCVEGVVCVWEVWYVEGVVCGRCGVCVCKGVVSCMCQQNLISLS